MKLLVSICVYMASGLWRFFADRLGLQKSGTIVGIFYHQILPNERGRFARQMAHLLRVASPISTNAPHADALAARRVFVTADDGWKSFADIALPETAKRGIPCTIFVISDRLASSLGEHNDRIVSYGELRAISSKLVTIGSHTSTHPKMTMLSDEEARNELSDSREMLREILGTEIDQFCFPFGAFDDRLFRLCREAGYRRVFVSTPYWSQANASFVAGRIRVDPSDWPLEFHLKLVGAYNWLAWVSLLKSKLTAWRRAIQQSQSPQRIEAIAIEDRGPSNLAKQSPVNCDE